VECSEPESVKSFDLNLLQARNEELLRNIPQAVERRPGDLQSYVVARLKGSSGAAPWLDSQSITQAVKACEMLGALLVDGPMAQISRYTDIDWARVGDVGFGICASGDVAITNALKVIRQKSGHRSGRTGPQAVFGMFYIWLEYSGKPGAAGPICELLREVILMSFAIGPGEIVLGEVVERRVVHSIYSLKSVTGLGAKRLHRLLQKAGIIPENMRDEAIAHWVFPAEQAEQLLARIVNSVPKNQLNCLLGCSYVQSLKLAASKLITSVVPVEYGEIGLSVGAYNRDDIADFLRDVCKDVQVVSKEIDGLQDLTTVCKGKIPTEDVVRWQIAGKLEQTRLLGGAERLDRLRFSPEEVGALVKAKRRTDLHSLRSVAARLCVSIPAAKQPTGSHDGGSLLGLASEEEMMGQYGSAYVSTATIERFMASYVTLGMAAKLMGVHHTTAMKFLDSRVARVSHPSTVGIRLYHRLDVEAGADDHRTQEPRPTQSACPLPHFWI
jgi:hypothetical protein